jgi:hypothetical protein
MALVPLDNRDAITTLHGLHGGSFATRSGTDDNHVVVKGRHKSTSSNPWLPEQVSLRQRRRDIHVGSLETAE